MIIYTMETQQLWKGKFSYLDKSNIRASKRRKSLATKKNDFEIANEREKFEVSNSLKTKPKRRVSSSRPTLKNNTLGRVDSRLTSSMQVIGHQVKRDIGSASSTRSARERPSLQRRAHTSLGFTWNSLSQQFNSSTRGFDVAGYVKRCGTAEGIQIGVNGRLVNIETYLDKSEKSEDWQSSSDSEGDNSGNCLKTVSEGNLVRHRVPLSWEEQLKLAEVSGVLLRS